MSDRRPPLYAVAFPDGLVSVFEPTEARGRFQLSQLVDAALALHLTVPVVFELRLYDEVGGDTYEVVDALTATPQGAPE